MGWKVISKKEILKRASTKRNILLTGVPHFALYAKRTCILNDVCHLHQLFETEWTTCLRTIE